jgi:signal transduction histidine kinase
MRFGIAPRILVAGLVVVAFLAIRLVFVVYTFHGLHHTITREQHAEEATLVASRIESLVLDLETGTRGYILTHDNTFLQPWRMAQAELPAQSIRLQELDPGSETAAIASAWRVYLRDYSRPAVRLVQVDPAAARSRLVAGKGKQRVDAIRALIGRYMARTVTATADERREAARQQHLGIQLALAAIGLSIVLFGLIVGYFVRTAVLPLRRIAAATGDVAAGRIVSVPERGAGEVGRLAAAFNEMARSLERSQRDLEEQNVDLERLANLLRGVLDATIDGILLSDRDGGVQLANRPMLTMAEELGMSRGENVVDNLLSIAELMVDSASYRAAIERLRTSPDEETFNEFELAGTGRVFQGFTSPVHDLRGAFTGRIWTLREVTQQRELDRLKDDFVATVSHELRTPLTSMMGFLEMIRAGDAGELTEDQQRFLTIVYRSSERLQRLVDDLLFVARVDANGLQLHLGDVQVDQVVAEVAEAMSALAQVRELELVVEVEPVPALRGDRERLIQIVANLLSNAIKFTPAGGRVVARTFARADVVTIEIEDTGIGVPPAEQERLFERFFRSTTATAHAIPGTGLGLVIARAIAEAHGGAITVRSEEGAGACFRVELPAGSEAAAA